MGFDPTPRHAIAALSSARHGVRKRASLASGLLLAAALLIAAFVALGARSAPTAKAAVAPVGQDFTLTTGDLHFILHQIQIAEHHAATVTPSNQCGTLVGPGPDQIPDRLSSYGLRTTDGSCNNLFPGRENFAAANQQFPRLATPASFRSADKFDDPDLPFPVGPPGQTSTYDSTSGNVVDGDVRTVSNLVVDQTSTNPAAVAAANFPVRTQGAQGSNVCSDPPSPHDAPNCVTLQHKTLFIPNVSTDVGLSPPYNSWFTFFGQFFDHGVDQTVKSGGAVFIPLRQDDPLRTLGPDGIPNNGDEVSAAKGNDFMVLTRTTNLPGPDGVLGTADDIHEASNTDTPWVDQSQTYTSHSSHQVFLREYKLDANNHPIATGKLLGGDTVATADGMANWGAVKTQAADVLGLQLTDYDVSRIPLLATDPYGKFIPGPARGLPQYVTKGPDGIAGTADDVLVEGDLANPVAVPKDVVYFDTPFIGDIAHNADPGTVGPCNTFASGVPAGCMDPDQDTVASADFANQPPHTYDDEMLNAHFCAGDGRVNENIALTTVHQIFHSEHNRLVDYIDNIITSGHDSVGGTVTAADQAAWHAIGNLNPNEPNPGIYNYGERLFQAARFVTEMEYQHLVFEEFARKLAPAIHPFHVYAPDINPAIPAEFAHAVYRFGHSMLDDTVARINPDGTNNDVPLLTAFLNPPEFFNGHTFGKLTPKQAAGSVVMGSVDQTGNEIDEFVTETLRNNLLGLPLDLPSINMARARDAGVPPLNVLRKDIFRDTGDAQLAPYTSWADYGQHLKHPESLINYVAAYGTHPTILAANTIAGKRAAARAIVDPDPALGDVPPADAADFLFSNGAWAGVDANGRSKTGLDDVDLWVGGLGEVTNLFGGMLGSTFNYVFQHTLERLQDNDRLYYLNRTPGLNLRNQLEGNSFQEMIERNTDGTTTLKDDVFGTADCKFQLANMAGTPAGFTANGSIVADDPATGCDESKLLIRSPDGTIAYRQRNTVDPSGINRQSVYNGVDDALIPDRINGGNDNDTIFGNAGNDILDGQGGDDVTYGGAGNDSITDLDGADVLKGGPGNDYLNGGTGNDLNLGGDGSDFTEGGPNDNETFGGPGTDYINAGEGADTAFGDGGSDWIQGGSGQDLLQGDHGAPFFDDPGETAAPGNDVFVGQTGENDYDAEGGDDLMAADPAIDRNAGAGGFDWAFHQYDEVAAANNQATTGTDDDMQINNQLAGLPLPVVVNRDRWQETEADSGGPLDDIIKGDDNRPDSVGGAGFTGCDVLDQAGVDRIKGLSAILPQPLTGDLAPVVALSATGSCPLSGPIWGEGNIITGGGGNDQLTGRGANDVIDGDRALTVHIAVMDGATELGRTDLMEHTPTSGNFGPSVPAGMTLEGAVKAGLVDPGNLQIVRELAIPAGTGPGDCGSATPTNCDTAVFLGPRSSYTITANANGSITVNQTGPLGATQKVSDDVDTLWNIEQLKFTDQTLTLAAPAAPTIGTATASNGAIAFASGTATVTWTRAPAVFPAITSQEIVVSSGGSVVKTVTGIAATATSRTITGLTNGTAYTFQVRAVSSLGAGPLSASTAPVTPIGLAAAPTAVTAHRLNASADLSWLAPNDGGSAISGYKIQVRTGGTLVRTDTVGNTTSTTITGLNNGTAYNFRVQAVNAKGSGALSAASNAVTPATVPGAPGILAPAQGPAGGALTAVANWTAPASNGGAAITGYTVRALRMAADGVTPVGTPTVANVGAAARSRSFTLPAGNYRFEVVANNSAGSSDASARSDLVSPR